jgi:signal transduction histidine kinase
MISAAQMYFETLVAKIGPADPVLIDGVREYLGLAVDECRNVIATMRPGLLEDLGLLEGLRKYVDDLSRRSSRRIEFHAVGPDARLDEAIGGNLFRIVHEAVANAIRHSGSDRILVSLKRTSRRLTVQVGDWGCGFDVRATQPLSQGGQHIGLRVMEERAALIGGRFSLSSAPGKGTTVAVDLVLPEAARDPGEGER